MHSTRIDIIDNGEPLVDIRRAGGLLYGPPPQFPEAEDNYCLMRETVYEKLLRVDASLQGGYRLRLFEGFRDLAFQASLFEQELKRVQAREPHLRPVEVHLAAGRLIAPVEHWDGSSNIPPHATGGAVDLEIVDDQGEVIDFGMTVKDWMVVEPHLHTPQSPLLSRTAKAHRLLLEKVMALEGFVKYHHQWWHFSYGDVYWAQATRQRVAFYGLCTAEMIRKARSGPDSPLR